MKPSISSPVPSPAAQEPELCRVTQWAKAWAEHFRHNMDEQHLADAFVREALNQPLPVRNDSEIAEMDTLG